MSTAAIDKFMSWLDCMIEEYTMDDGYDDDVAMGRISTHERHQREGMVKMLLMVEDRAKKVGFIIPPVRGQSLDDYYKKEGG